MKTEQKTDEQQASELLEIEKELSQALGDEASFVMTTRADVMALSMLLINKGVLTQGEVTNAMYEERKALLYQLKMNEAAEGDGKAN